MITPNELLTWSPAREFNPFPKRPAHSGITLVHVPSPAFHLAWVCSTVSCSPEHTSLSETFWVLDHFSGGWVFALPLSDPGFPPRFPSLILWGYPLAFTTFSRGVRVRVCLLLRLGMDPILPEVPLTRSPGVFPPSLSPMPPL